MHEDAAPDRRPVDIIYGRASDNLSASRRKRVSGQAGLREASRNFGRCFRNQRAIIEHPLNGYPANARPRELSKHLLPAVILRARIVVWISFCQQKTLARATRFDWV
jgi:hypothetical protein